MISEKEISALIRKEIRAAFHAPNVITKEGSIEAIARRVMQRYDDWYTLQTTDATPTVIVTIEIEDETVGMIDFTILAIKGDGTAATAVRRYVRVHKTGGTLTIIGMADWSEDDLLLAILPQVNGDDNMEIQVTGVAATIIDWKCDYVKKQLTATALP